MSTKISNCVVTSQSGPDPWLRYSAFFSEPLLLEGDKRSEYIEIRDQILNATQPRDSVEVVLVISCVDSFWECRGLKRLRHKLIRSSEIIGVTRLLETLSGQKNDSEIAKKCVRGEKKAQRYLGGLLKKAGLDREVVTAQTMGVIIDPLQKMDQAIQLREHQFALSLRALHGHRDMLGRSAREVITQIEEEAVTLSLGDLGTIHS